MKTLFGKPVRLGIFDVDGVILDFPVKFEENIEVVAHSFRLPIPPLRNYFAEVRRGSMAGGVLLNDNIKYIWPHWADMVTDEFLLRFSAQQRLNPPPLIPGSSDALTRLKESGLFIALCTNRKEQTLFDGLLGVGIGPSAFDAMSTHECGYQKPDRRCFDPIFEKLPVGLDEAFFVGDWVPDMEAARAAGIRFIAVTSGFISKQVFLEHGVPKDHILPSIAYLPPLITNEAPR